MENKLEYLKKYNSNAEILDITLTDISSASPEISSVWQNILKKKSFKEKLYGITNLWKEYCANELSNTIYCLSENCCAIDLIRVNDKFSILYSIKNSKGEILYYEGRFPDQETTLKKKIDAWENLSIEIRNFYSHIHNGFYYYASESMGLLPLNSTFRLDEEEWGILQEIKEPLRINLETTYAFFSNGMGSYVCLDTQNHQAVLWSSKKKPNYDVNFWDVIDEWIVIGFD